MSLETEQLEVIWNGQVTPDGGEYLCIDWTKHHVTLGPMEQPLRLWNGQESVEGVLWEFGVVGATARQVADWLRQPVQRIAHALLDMERNGIVRMKVSATEFRYQKPVRRYVLLAVLK